MPGKNKKYTLGQAPDLHDVTLPSGQTCQARRPGVQGMIEAGLLDSFDELTAIVQSEHIAPKTPQGMAAADKVTPGQVKSASDILMQDPTKLAAAFHLIDRMIAGVVVTPAVWVDYQMKDEPDKEWTKRQEKALEDEAVPVRQIDLDDKMFLVEWAVGGSPDITSFREGREKLMVDLASSQAIQLPA